jgi:hypothetical protein
MWHLGQGRSGQKALWKYIRTKNGKKKNLDLFYNGQCANTPEVVAEALAKYFNCNFNSTYINKINDTLTSVTFSHNIIENIPINVNNVTNLLKSLRAVICCTLNLRLKSDCNVKGICYSEIKLRLSAADYGP